MLETALLSSNSLIIRNVMPLGKHFMIKDIDTSVDVGQVLIRRTRDER